MKVKKLKINETRTLGDGASSMTKCFFNLNGQEVFILVHDRKAFEDGYPVRSLEGQFICYGKLEDWKNVWVR